MEFFGNPNQAVEGVHMRTVISKFGGVIKHGTAVAMPPQERGGLQATSFQRRLAPTDGKGRDLNVHRDRAGGWMVGYAGHRPGARDVSNTMAYGGVPLFHRYDGPRAVPGQGTNMVNRATTAWQEIAPTLKDAAPGARIVGGAGVPGYMGHLPNGYPTYIEHEQMAEQARRIGRTASAPAGMEATTSKMTAQVISYAPKRSRATDYKVFEGRRLLPERMPLVGYTGHLRRTKDSVEAFGTSYFKPNAPPSRQAAAAIAYESAKKKALDAHQPSDAKGGTDPCATHRAWPHPAAGTPLPACLSRPDVLTAAN